MPGEVQAHRVYYRGAYLIADAAPLPHRSPAQRDPGDDDQDDHYDPEHPEIQALLLVVGPDRDSALNAELNSIDALVLLVQETT